MASVLRVLFLIACSPWLGVSGQSLPEGWAVEGHAMVLGVDSTRVYVAQADGNLSASEAMQAPWTVWSAPCTGGALTPLDLKPMRPESWASLGFIQHVSVDPSGRRAVLSARRKVGGEGDLDLFVSHKLPPKRRSEGVTWTEPVPLDGLNTVADEALPHWHEGAIRFATNASGSFEVREASWRTQWLRHESALGEAIMPSEACSAIEAMPGLTWVTALDPVTGRWVVRALNHPEPEATMAEGWTLCLDLPSSASSARGERLLVRHAQTRRLRTVLETDSKGCVSLEGLPSGEAWVFEWQPSETRQGEESVAATVFSPDGVATRSHVLEGANGWAFVFLPLDAIAAMGMREGADGSQWPWVPQHVVFFARGASEPTSEAARALGAWLVGGVEVDSGKWQVVGHADNTGNEEDNQKLSLARARAVANRLEEAWGVDADALVVSGKGSTVPMGKNPERNRRVEVRWVPALQ